MNAKSSKISVFNSNPLMQLAFYGNLYSSPYYDVGGTCNGLSLASGRLAGMEMAKYVAE